MGRGSGMGSGGATGSSIDIYDSVAPPPYLDQVAIDAAIKNVVLAAFPKSAPLTGPQRESWVEVLGYMHPGELRPALAARTDDKSYRPDPYAILQIVQTTRTAKITEKRRRLEAGQMQIRQTEAAAYVRTDSTTAAAEECFAKCAALGIGRRAKPGYLVDA